MVHRCTREKSDATESLDLLDLSSENLTIFETALGKELKVKNAFNILVTTVTCFFFLLFN